jgi:hypothetical protein
VHRRDDEQARERQREPRASTSAGAREQGRVRHQGDGLGSGHGGERDREQRRRSPMAEEGFARPSAMKNWERAEELDELGRAETQPRVTPTTMRTCKVFPLHTERRYGVTTNSKHRW